MALCLSPPSLLSASFILDLAVQPFPLRKTHRRSHHATYSHALVAQKQLGLAPIAEEFKVQLGLVPTAQDLNSTICLLGPDTDVATYASLLRRCTLEKSHPHGELLHDLIIRLGHADNLFLNNLLVQMYGKCGSLQHACAVFVNMSCRNLYSWTIVLAACAQNGHGKEALHLFAQMQAEGFEPDIITCICVLDACASVEALEEGQQIHAIVVANGEESDVVLGTALVNMYGKCGSLADARAAFAEMPWRNVVSWNAMITASTQNGHSKEALQLFVQMEAEGVEPSRVTSICVLDACASMASLEEGREIHGNVVGNGWDSDVVVGNALVTVYGKCGCIDDASAVFVEMPQRNVVSWNAMIAACAQNLHGKEALQLFDQMQAEGFLPDKITSISVLDACASMGALEEGQAMHTCVIGNGWESDVVVGNALITMYGKCGSLDDVRAVFEEMPSQNVVSWNAMISACAWNGYGNEALRLFDQMQAEGFEPDMVTSICILDACATMAAVEEGREFHASVVGNGWESNVVVGNALVNMYGKWGSLNDARAVFEEMPQRDVVSWNAMIAVNAQNGEGKEALHFYGQMQAEGFEPAKITSICALDACASVENLVQGQGLHANVVSNGWESDIVVGTALINLYSKCRSLDDARAVFVEMRQRNGVLWSAMITASAQNGYGKEALQLYSQMQDDGFEPDKVTSICVLDACADVAALDEGPDIHSYVVANGWESDVVVGSSLINMYGKCGSLEEARAVFAEMPQRDVVTWNAMISVCAQNGSGDAALELFAQMQDEGFEPGTITFTCVLTACSHMGLVADAKQYFNSMSQDHSISPSMEHYMCMIDIFGRAGQLDKAEQLINSMPFQPVASAWLSLLSSCRLHGDVERGLRAARQVVNLDEKNASPYILLSNIHAAAGMLDDGQNAGTQ